MNVLGLLPLSLHRAPRLGRRMPHVPTHEDRLRAWRAAHAPAAGNAVTDWRALAEKVRGDLYAITETMDGRTPSDDTHWRNQ